MINPFGVICRSGNDDSTDAEKYGPRSIASQGVSFEGGKSARARQCHANTTSAVAAIDRQVGFRMRSGVRTFGIIIDARAFHRLKSTIV
jgi:hypothetical protein